ncbi:MAG: DUF3078 domain-containing protein [Weeksellaceae bacterium]|nr:DUF3078 domain-containing protein [Weeksellaceae bacterium]
MKKLLLLCLLSAGTLYAQLNQVQTNVDQVSVQRPDTLQGWRTSGTLTFLFNQSSFSNWVAGGVNNYGGNIGVNYNINYDAGPNSWDNRIMIGYGMAKNEGQELRKTDDRFEINSLYGRTASGNWSYSFFGNLRTQLTNGYLYDNDQGQNYPISGFFKPGYLTFGPGMMWRRNDNLKINLAPLTSKITMLSGEVFTYDDATQQFISSNQVRTFGVDPGQSMRYELGFFAQGYAKFNLMQNVSVENILSLYSNYLDRPQNIDIDHTLNIVMPINRYLSTNLTLQSVYDHDAINRLQFRQLFGLGLNVNL